MPAWAIVLLAVLGAWLLLSVVVAFAVGRAIRIADRRRPRKPRSRPRSARKPTPSPGERMLDDEHHERRRAKRR